MLPRVGTGVGLRPDGRAGAEEDTGEMAQHREVHKRAGPCGMDRGRARLRKSLLPYFIKLHGLVMLLRGVLLTGPSPLLNSQDGCSISLS